MDAAEAFRDLPGLALLESARPGRTGRWSYLTADPVAVVDAPSDGADPFAEARSTAGAAGRRRRVGRRRRHRAGRAPVRRRPRRGTSATTSGDGSSGCPRSPAVDQHLPALRLALHDWALAWDRRTGTAWLAGEGGRRRCRAAPRRRVAAVRERLDAAGSRRGLAGPPARPRRRRSPSLTSHDAWIRDVEAVRDAIARGDIYQANLTRRLEAPFDGDPWPRLPPPAHRRPGPVRRLPRHRPVAGQRPAARAAVRLARAVPVGRWRAASCPRTRSRAPGRAAATARAGPRARPRAPREPQGPGRERDDRGRAAQRPRAGLRAGLRAGAAAPPARAHGGRPAPRDHRDRPAPPRRRTPSTCSPPRSPAAASRARRRSGRWS